MENKTKTNDNKVETSEKKIVNISSRGRRLGAGIIDEIPGIIIVIIFMIAYISLIVGAVQASYSSYSDSSSSHGMGAFGFSIGAMILCLILSIALIVVEIVFYARSQSIGKAILGMRVVDDKTGEPIGFWKMLLREFILKTASSSVFCLGFIWILIDGQNRGWHDKILDTLVVDISKEEKEAEKAEKAAVLNYTGNAIVEEVEPKKESDK